LGRLFLACRNRSSGGGGGGPRRHLGHTAGVQSRLLLFALQLRGCGGGTGPREAPGTSKNEGSVTSLDILVQLL
jgi:hypothetical protein